MDSQRSSGADLTCLSRSDASNGARVGYTTSDGHIYVVRGSLSFIRSECIALVTPGQEGHCPLVSRAEKDRSVHKWPLACNKTGTARQAHTFSAFRFMSEAELCAQ